MIRQGNRSSADSATVPSVVPPLGDALKVRLFDTILESITDGFVTFDADFRFIYLNAEAERILGIRRDQLLGRTQWEVFPETAGTEQEREYRRAVAERVTVEFDTYYQPWDRNFHLKCYPTTEGGLSVYFQDTTERKRAESALRESEARSADQKEAFELALSGAPIHDVLNVLVRAGQRRFGADARTAIFIVSPDGLCLRHGASAGLTETYTRAVDGFGISPDNPSCGSAAYTGNAVIVRDVAADPLWQPYMHLAQEHGIRACWSFPIRSSGGKVVGTFAVYHRTPREPDAVDLERVRLLAQTAALVIERHMAEEALRQANSRLEERVRERTAQLTEVNAKFQAMYDQGVFAGFLDPAGRVIDANRSSLEQCGFTRGDVIGKPFWDCGWWNRSPALQAWIREAFEQAVAGRPFRGESPYFCADGTERVVEFAMMPIKDDAGRVVFILPTGIDVTERRQAERDREAGDVLRASESRFRQLADTMPQMIWVTRPDGYHEYYNRRWYEFTGVPEGSTDGEGWNEMFHPDDQGRAWERWRHSLATGEPYEIEYRLKHRSGNYRWTLGRALPVRNERGEIERWFGTCTDIDALKRLTAEREQLLQNERAARAEAESANRAKDTFLAVLSHELRTPLSPVVMTIPAMEMDPDMPFKFREDLAMVRRNIDLEVKLIDDLLDLSRVTSGKLRLQMQPVRVHELLRHVVQSSASEAAGKRLHVRQELGAENDVLSGDPARLQQVFWNLLRNAVKFTPEGGEVVVRTGNSDGGRRLLVEVNDTGVGISPDVLPRIFEAFEQGGLRMTGQFGGMGLGLAIAKAVVEMHGGSIRAASDGPQKGATFTVELVTVHDAAAGADHLSPAPAAGRRHARSRVLLVEDHPDTSRAMTRLLTNSGYDVRAAHSVASALQLAAAEPFDIVVSDLGLPDATGYELMEQIRDRYGITGIALSGYGMEEDMRKSREAGFADHVIKPVNLAQLEAVIQRVLGGQRPG